MDRNVPTTTQDAWSWTSGPGSPIALNRSLRSMDQHGKTTHSFMTDLEFYSLAAAHRFLFHAVLEQVMDPACLISVAAYMAGIAS